MTYSLIARDPNSGQIGIAVASRFFACGAFVPHVGARSAVATQAFVNPLWGTDGLSRLEAGEGGNAVLSDMVRRDGARAIRQCHMLDAEGRFAAHTGAECIDWCGHRTGELHSVAGNMLAGPQVVDATFDAFSARSNLPFAARMLAAMRAGEEAGGDKRGRQAAGLKITRGESYAILDLRADDHDDPLGELDRLLDVAGERYLHVAETFATTENFSGVTDRGPIDAAIAAEEDRRAREGVPSRSRATTKGL